LPNSSSRHATHSEEQGRAINPGRVDSDPPRGGSAPPGDPPPAIHLEHISKTYGSINAVDRVSFDVHPGEIFGFLGLNGAGKTTTIRIILDLVRPTSGRAFVHGLSCRHESLAVRSRIGFLPGELGFYEDMTGKATLDVLARLNDTAVDRARQNELLERMQLSTRDLGRKVREYSTGMKRKLGIVQAFQSDRPLLILDEPTEGLDPLMQDALYELLVDTRRRGRTVFMSSHVLSEVERVCDRIGLLRRGELALVSAVADVRRMAARQVRVTFREDVNVGFRGLSAELPPDCEVVERTPRAWTMRVRGPLGPLLDAFARHRIEDLEVREPHLEEVLKTYYKEQAPPR
jgi:ABC-2 type transport system ATP-binding protein